MKKELLLLIALASLLSIPMQQAYAANITGVVKFGGSGLADAKVTAERVGEYKWTRTATSGSIGSYTLVVDSTNSYTVATAKTGYTRASTTISGGSGAPDLNVLKNPITNIMFKVAFDIGPSSQLTIDQARFYLYSAEPWFIEEHSIHFQEAGQGTAFSAGSSSVIHCDPPTSGNMLDTMASATNWSPGNYGIAKVLVGFTGKNFHLGTGCINDIPTSSNTYPYMAITNHSPDIARTVMHEISHAFGLRHANETDPFCHTHIPGIMVDHCPSIYIKNWNPAEDLQMQANRNWYSYPPGFHLTATQQSNGNAINGLNVVVLNPSGVIVANGFTPLSYTPTTTGTYTIRFNNYGNYYFTTIPSASYITSYNVYSWGGEIKINVTNVNDAYHAQGVYYNHASPGNYARMTFQSSYTNGLPLNGMNSATRDISGTYLTKGYTPFTVGLPTNQNLTVVWNNFSTNYYQYADTNATELFDNKYSWGGEQGIRMSTNGGTYTDTGRYSTTP